MEVNIKGNSRLDVKSFVHYSIGDMSELSKKEGLLMAKQSL